MGIEAKDLKALVRECAKRGVAELKIGNVHIKFGGVTPAKTPEAKSEILAPTAEELKSAEQKSLVEENVSFAEDRLALLQLEDPVAYERMIIERELEEDGEAAQYRGAEPDL